MRQIYEIIEIRIHLFPGAQDWPVFLLRKRVPDWTGLSPCSKTGSPTRLVCLSLQEEGVGLDWPPYSRRVAWTLLEPILRLVLQPFWAYLSISLFKIIENINISITGKGQSDTCIFQSYWKHKSSMGEHFYLSNQKILLGAHYMHKKECYGHYTLTWFWVWSFWGAP